MTRRDFMVSAGALAATLITNPLQAVPASIDAPDPDAGQRAAVVWVKRYASAEWEACHKRPSGPLYAVVTCYGDAA